jgi:hypothetical protein
VGIGEAVIVAVDVSSTAGWGEVSGIQAPNRIRIKPTVKIESRSGVRIPRILSLNIIISHMISSIFQHTIAIDKELM